MIGFCVKAHCKLLAGALIALSVYACDSYEVTPVTDAAVHLPFETSLENIGPAPMTVEAHDGKAAYKKSKTGRALFAQGDGGWVEATPAEKLMLGDVVEISFDFNRADWTNPYKAGSATQTLVAISGRSEKKIQHLAFNISVGSVPSLYAVIEDADGEKHRLTAPAGAVSPGWHQARLYVDRRAGRASFYLDETLVAEEAVMPAVLINGIERIKFGTWHKKNQAYRGHLDNFVIRDIREETGAQARL
ncbi:MAG: hypothetical protein AAFX54_02380 [Pseudomonadota bacterium]